MKFSLRKKYFFVNDSKATSFQVTKFALASSKIFIDTWWNTKI